MLGGGACAVLLAYATNVEFPQSLRLGIRTVLVPYATNARFAYTRRIGARAVLVHRHYSRTR
jgi:hypothetical protein